MLQGAPHYMGKTTAPPTVYLMGVMRKRIHNQGTKIIHVKHLKYVVIQIVSIINLKA